MRSFLKYWLPVLIWLGFIFIGSTDLMSSEQTSRFLIPFLRWLRPGISPETLAQIHFLVRKLGHVTEYAVLAMLFWRALRGGMRPKFGIGAVFMAVWLVSAIFAATDEFHQSLVLSRTAAVGDVMIDICGALAGVLICWVLARHRIQSGNQEPGPEGFRG
jgi:VanZ family protein